ncbi:hypothetical protein GGF46_001039 [Coemansia sp. RSA 552]|nr:hypothetical protein GGF46_001039 [Coemansia sp. RSA 552]
MHDYRPTTFVSPTFCELCGGFLWGLAKQGVRCQKCSSTAHKGCAFDAVTKCTGDRGLAALAPSGGQREGSAVTMCPGDAPGHAEQSEAEYIQRLDGMFWQQVDEEAKANTLASQRTEQPLSLFQTLPANFMQFTAKLAPLSIVQRQATEIVLWRRPRYSLAAMGVYSMYCLRPNLLLATPLALMIAYIAFTYVNSVYYRQRLGGDSRAEGLSRDLARPRRLTSALFNIVPRSSLSPSPPLEEASGPQIRSRLGGRRRSSQSSQHAPIATPSSAAPSMVTRSTVARSTVARSTASQMSGEGEEALGPGAKCSRRNSMGPTESHMGDARARVAAAAVAPNSAPSSPKPNALVQSTSFRSDSPRAGSIGPAVDLGALLGAASFGSARYTENVHTTQIMTGTYVGVYDWVAAHNHLVDWSNPDMTWHILLACICAQAVVLVTVYWVPWYLLFLVGGNTGMLSMSPHVRAFGKVYGVEFALYLHEWALVRWHLASQRVARALIVQWVWGIAQWVVNRCRRRRRRYCRGASDGNIQFASPSLLAQDSSDDDDDEGRSGYTTPPVLLSLDNSTAGSSAATLMRRAHLVSVFENQRWWLGFGWIPRLGSSERAKWSDETGRRRFASIKDFLPEDGYEWADDDGGGGGSGWEIDRRWALPVGTDEDGWVYTDNFWRRPAPAPSAMSSYTRRRRWIRQVRPASRADVTKTAVAVR